MHPVGMSAWLMTPRPKFGMTVGGCVNYQKAVIVGQCVRSGFRGSGLLRLWVMMEAAMESYEARTCVPHLPAIRVGPLGAMIIP